MTKILTNKKVLIVNPRNLDSKESREAYNMWLTTWNDAINNDLKLNRELYSDEFTRQDEICCLYDYEKDKCIGLSFLKYVDFNCPSAQNDSYFKEWSHHAKTRLVERGKKVAICSQFTISLDYREQRVPFKWKDILGFTVVNHFISTKSDVMTGAVRVNKGVSKASVSFGGEVLEKNVFNNNYKAHEDLIAFYKQDIKEHLKASQFQALQCIFEPRVFDSTKAAA